MKDEGDNTPGGLVAAQANLQPCEARIKVTPEAMYEGHLYPEGMRKR
jgi:hypothetical protein